MTTKATRTGKTPKQEQHQATLAQFARTIDEHVGRAVGFDRHVIALHKSKVQLAALVSARQRVHAHVKRARMVGHSILNGTDGQVYEIRETEPRPPIRYRAAASAVVRKADDRAWRRANIDAPFVQVKAPLTVTQGIPLIEAPDGVAFMPPAEAVTVYKNHPAWYDLRRLNLAVETTKAALLTIADLCEWDGGVELGPSVFRDGWTVQLRRAEYRSDKLAEVEPELFERLAEIKLKHVAPRIYVRLAGSNVTDDELGEYGEMDGD